MTNRVLEINELEYLQKEAEIERIPGLPYTYEECIADIRKSEEDYAMGRTITSEKLKERMATWNSTC